MVAARQPAAYIREDFEIMRHIAEAARFTPGLWLLNRIALLWIEASTDLQFAIRPPEDYVPAHSKLFDLLEAHESEAARKWMGDYLDRHDALLIKVLEAL
jgi:DNA-binding FadR family transcriptional regulator